MPTHLYLAPAAAGKTTWVLEHARHAAHDLTAIPRVLVATHLQARAARRRLAEMGGALGVRVLTFDRLYAEVLNATGEIYVELSEPVQYRLIRTIIDSLDLDHYAPLVTRPGFVQVLQRLIGELKAARVHPDDFTQAVHALGHEPRLVELAQIYAAYQQRLQAQKWADRAGLGWLAVEALEQQAPNVARDWPLLAVDGFDSFTPVQAMLLRALAGRVNALVITLTGDPLGGLANPAHRRYAQTRTLLQDTLGIQAAPLPASQDPAPPANALAHLAHNLFLPQPTVIAADGALDLIEASDRVGEVRAALRWLKRRIVQDGCQPGELALLARHITPYRAFIQQVADEFGLPIRLVDGMPLSANPAVAALLNLLQTTLPANETSNEPSLHRRSVVEAWRSPYFDWSTLAADGGGIQPGDADDLDTVARWGRVIGGVAQWSEAFDRLIELPGTTHDDDARSLPPRLVRGDRARTLRTRFERCVTRLTPPTDASTFRDFVGWLETLIGSDTATTRDPSVDEPTSLHIVTRARADDTPHAARDVAALAAFKDVLRGLVWAEEAVGGETPVSYRRFVTELAAALAAASYNLPPRPGQEEILVADVIQARGLPFHAVAVLGMAEGEFPTTLREDPFLRDADRQRLRAGPGALPLEPSIAGTEAGFFADAVSRAHTRLLLTRPRRADNGATWQASPYWETVCRLVVVAPVRLVGESAPSPGDAASWPELLTSLAVSEGHAALRQWVHAQVSVRARAVDDAVTVLQQRRRFGAPSPFDGDLSTLAGDLADRFAPNKPWSVSRLESYRACPFAFLAASVLNLAPRVEPAEGLDVSQLGNIYHRIFERLYGAVVDRRDTAGLLAALPAVAATVLDEAPAREGFRVTAWWQQSRAEIETNVRRSVEALAALPGDFVPVVLEGRFGDTQDLTLTDGGDTLRLHGIIDRVDRAPDGSLRIIDYKTAGPSAFTDKAIHEGKKLQIPLYALAAEQALKLGHIVDGFYWHVQHAEASKFTLSRFDGGPDAAIRIARDHAWAAVRGARAGLFAPHPPSEGCPDYCPAAAFCWHYRPRRGQVQA